MDSLRDQLRASLGAAYVIERELTGSGMSRVFLAVETRFKRRVVIKLLSPDLAAGLSTERFEREIGLAAALQHPNIVPVITAGDLDGLPWYSMPFVDGESLRARIDVGSISTTEAVKILGDVARALAYSHAQGVVHRDIKPENVLLTGGAAVVTDFGIAKALSASRTHAPGGTLTVVGTSLGTPAYMAPEQAAGDDVDHRADLYAWGVVAYELLAARHPFAGKATAQQLIAAHIAEAPKPLSTAAKAVPATIAALVSECLAKDPARRPASAAELLARLEAASLGRSPSRKGGHYLVPGLAVVGVMIALGVWGTRHFGRGVTNSDLAPKRVVVATFTNRTGDPSLDAVGAMAADWIARGLSSTGLVDVAGTSSDIAARDASTRSASQTPAALATLAKAGIVISGTYYKQGDSVYFEADFTDANAARRIQSVGPVAGPIGRPLDGVELLRQRVTASLALQLDPRLGTTVSAIAQPPSMDAYREFLAGDDLFYAPNAADALPHYLRAAGLDSTYVYPLLRAITLLDNLGMRARADSIGRVLLRRADRLSPFERAYLDIGMASAHLDPQAHYDATHELMRAAPKSEFAKAFHALSANEMRRFHEADSLFSMLDP